MLVVIKESKTADSRAAEGIIPKEQVLAGTHQHIEDVQKALAFFMEKLYEAGKKHDHTKVELIDDFFEAFHRQQTEPDFKFKEHPWFHMHVTHERHHLKDHCPENVTLIDVLERICDITMAGMGRSGTVTPDIINPAILVTAYQNTIQLLAANTILRKDDE